MSELWSVSGEVRISNRGATRLRRGHPWVYRSDVKDSDVKRAGVVRVLDSGGNRVGTAFWSPSSEIRLRLLTQRDEEVDRGLIVSRLHRALQRRERLLEGVDGYRLVHGEADQLPGIFVDRYGDCLAVQTTCEAADRVEADVVQMLVELLNPRAVVLRDDTGARQREGLTRHVTLVRGDAPVRARYHEGEVELEVDLLEDQKTGGYLDQTHNHLAVRRYATGRALDCFTYHGGFALQLAAAGATVTAVDQSTGALARANENAARNQLKLETVEANVFDLLPQLRARGELFDVIVLDPPSFASGRKTIDAAMRAYKEINLRALKLLAPGGILVSCSCSGRVRSLEFDQMLHRASSDARRPLHMLESRSAGPDHPVLVGVPETDYLKCRILMAI